MEQAGAVVLSGEQAHQYHRAKLGMWLFLASEVMFFTGFIGSYLVLRMSNAEIAMESQKLLNWPLAAVNTFVLICSSLTMALGVSAAQKGERRKTSLFLLLTILLGTTFLVIKYFEYTGKFHHVLATKEERERILPDGRDIEDWEKKLAEAKENGATEEAQKWEQRIQDRTHGIYPHTNVFFGSYFTMTGFHGLHVLVGIFVLLLLLFRNLAGAYSAARFAPVELTGLYWHFVDIVWIFLFPILYLI